MRVDRAESCEHLQALLFADVWDAALGRWRSDAVYRGEGRASNELTTSLQRLGGPYAELERHLLRNFRKYAHRNVVERDSIWHWLAVAKHYGLPARLLDWTSSPYVALHFATANIERFDADGVVWVVSYDRVHDRLPARLRDVLAGEGASVFTVELLSQAVRSLDELPRLAPEPFAIFFEPPSIDDRIVNQYAFFSLLSDARLRLDEWLDAHAPDAWRRIEVPADLKWEVRDKLDQAGVNERVLFPGMDGLSAWLRRYYSPKARPA